MAQAEALAPLLNELNQAIEAVVLLEVADAVLVERLLGRGRADDNEEVIRNRLEVYKQQTAPLVDHYRRQNLLLTVKAEGSVEAIAERIESSLA